MRGSENSIETTRGAATPADRGTVGIGAGLLAVLVGLAWHNSFHVPFLFDDEQAIVANPTLDSFATALIPPTDSGSTVSGRPLLNLSFAVNRALHGLRLPGYHLANLLIHFAAALCLFGLVRRTLALPRGAPSNTTNHVRPTTLAWFAAALWAVHPLQTESVTYIVQRAEALVGLCLLFTLYTFVRAVTENSRRWLIASLTSCWIGMTAKEVMAAAPLLLLLYDRTFLAGTFGEAWRRRRGFHLACAAGWLVLLALIISSGGRGSTVGFGIISWHDYAATQGIGIAGYLRKALLPVGLLFDHGILIENRPGAVVAGLVFVGGLLGLTLWLLRRRPPAGFLGAWFFLILAPSSSVIPVASQTLAEHRMYLPLAAVVVAAILLAQRLPRVFAVGILGLLVAGATVGTILRNRDYASARVLWQDTVGKAPRNVRALNNLGVELWRAGDLAAASEHLGRAVEIAPDYADACSNLGAVIIERAVVRAPDLRGGAEVEEGLRLLRHAVARDPGRPLFHSALGVALFSLDRFDEAAASFARARELQPDQPVHVFNLANALAHSSRPVEAEALYREHLEVFPDDAEAHREYGILLRRLGRLEDSIAALASAVRLTPTSALGQTQLGVSLHANRRTDEALAAFEAALRLRPDLPLALKEKGYALAEVGRIEEAMTTLERLVTVAPPTAEVMSNLAVLYVRVGRDEDAKLALRRAVAIDPNNAIARRNLERLEGR